MTVENQFSPAFSAAFDAPGTDCTWPLDPGCLGEVWDSFPVDVQARAAGLASATLHRLTGYRVTNCPITVRPCRRSCAQQYGYFGGGGTSFRPHVTLDGTWVNGCGCRTSCSCGPLCEVALPAPVGEVWQVDIGGVDYTAQTKVQGSSLVYTGTEECPFPSCQDLAAPVGAPDTFSVTYLNGYPVDDLGAVAAGTLAVEYAKACAGQRCALPPGTTQVVRQGVTIEIAAGSFPNGMTGIRDVDSFIALWRPEGSPRFPPQFWSPTLHLPRVERP